MKVCLNGNFRVQSSTRIAAGRTSLSTSFLDFRDRASFNVALLRSMIRVSIPKFSRFNSVQQLRKLTYSDSSRNLISQQVQHKLRKFHTAAAVKTCTVIEIRSPGPTAFELLTAEM